MSSARGTILNVDDDEAGRYAASCILRRAGYRVVEAATGTEALALAATERPDLVLLDVKLPDISGLEICRRLKEGPDTAHILVLQISASFVNARDTVRGLESGADGYLAEPLEPAVLVATVNSLMRIQQTEAALRHSEARHRLLFERNPLPAWVVEDESLRIVAVNDAAVRQYGYTREEFLAMTLRHLAAGDQGATLVPATGPGPLPARETWQHLRKDRAVIEVEFTIAPVMFGDRPARLVLATDVTERRRAEQARAELLAREREARAQAEAANQAKDEFLAILSHELRTPLNAMYGWARMLRRGWLDETATQRALEAIERNTALQAQLIEDLLDVSRIVTGKLTLDTRPVDLADIAAAAVETVRSHAEVKNICLELATTPGVIVSGDPTRLEQVVANVLSNALKFTPAGGRVTVHVDHAKDTARVVVIDTGKGIRADLLPKIFERFRQADSSTTRSYSGLGLGLAIVRHLVELHGGKVAAHSDGPDRGATFTVTLPLLSGARDVPGEPARGPRPTDVSLQGVHVVVVDDNLDALALSRTVLEASGARVTVAASAQEALPLIERDPPDVVVSDLGMPGEDGFELMRRLRDHPGPRVRRIPALAFTAYATEYDAERALAAGYQMHVAKPLEPLTFAAAVAGLAGRA